MSSPNCHPILLLCAAVCSISSVNSVMAEDSFAVPKNVQTILSNRCLDCHSKDYSEDDVRLDRMEDLALNRRLSLLNQVQDQLFHAFMPPEDADPLQEKEKEQLAGWVRSELRRHDASELDQKLRYPDYGNFVDHEKLFSGEIREKPFTPSRRWLVSPQIFHERVNAVFQLTGNQRQKKFYGITNPIVLPDRSGVRYYDTTALDGGHLLVMLGNAKWISEKQILAASTQGVPRNQISFPNPKDRWVPPNSPEAFVKIVKKESVPTEQEMIDAIHAQFNCVLQREATDDELREYLSLLKSTIDLGGNSEGLRQMLLSVLLESDFLYRLEFGAGKPDEFGRKKLSPREASFAIAYAISDHGPDEQLVRAAEEGRLETKEDYQREVTRLLNDQKSFFGEVDPDVSFGYIKPHQTSHPKINRFFREFFGYPISIKLFKDTSRSGGFYDNAGRDYTGTAGSVTNEADRVVDLILKDDQDVFERLLTTDDAFVLHPFSNEKNQQIVDDWRAAYETLKATEWKEKTKEVLLENFERHKKHFDVMRVPNLDENRLNVHVRRFKQHMEYFENTFGRGITPVTFAWFHHGGQKFRYSEIYNLPKIPGAGPLQARGYYLDDVEYWDYPLHQPFKLDHRKGILTHPAWLLAHSQNTATDPVKRGRWIREKLLAGRVPDVPITVDAQIPEDPHHTLRERLDSVTHEQQCWKCHRQMNPLGVTFEIFDDFGRYRTEEALEHPDNLLEEGDGFRSANVYKTKPVDARGTLTGTGDPDLDGDVQDAFELIDRLAQSDRVRQSIIRHAFRYYMGRNELLSDSQTLIDADRAYLKSGGSFKAVIVSLLTSDSFMYRK